MPSFWSSSQGRGGAHGTILLGGHKILSFLSVLIILPTNIIFSLAIWLFSQKLETMNFLKCIVVYRGKTITSRRSIDSKVRFFHKSRFFQKKTGTPHLWGWEPPSRCWHTVRVEIVTAASANHHSRCVIPFHNYVVIPRHNYSSRILFAIIS